jgi:hypothetical protein
LIEGSRNLVLKKDQPVFESLLPTDNLRLSAAPGGGSAGYILIVTLLSSCLFTMYIYYPATLHVDCAVVQVCCFFFLHGFYLKDHKYAL